MIRCPVRIRPRDFDALEGFADLNPNLAELAEELAWGENDKMSWGIFFGALREFRVMYS